MLYIKGCRTNRRLSLHMHMGSSLLLSKSNLDYGFSQVISLFAKQLTHLCRPQNHPLFCIVVLFVAEMITFRSERWLFFNWSQSVPVHHHPRCQYFNLGIDSVKSAFLAANEYLPPITMAGRNTICGFGMKGRRRIRKSAELKCNFFASYAYGILTLVSVHLRSS